MIELALDRLITNLAGAIDALDDLTRLRPSGVNQSSRRVLAAYLDDALSTREQLTPAAAGRGVEWGGR
jgi:hypothetical protein